MCGPAPRTRKRFRLSAFSFSENSARGSPPLGKFLHAGFFSAWQITACGIPLLGKLPLAELPCLASFRSRHFPVWQVSAFVRSYMLETLCACGPLVKRLTTINFYCILSPLFQIVKRNFTFFEFFCKIFKNILRGRQEQRAMRQTNRLRQQIKQAHPTRTEREAAENNQTTAETVNNAGGKAGRTDTINSKEIRNCGYHGHGGKITHGDGRNRRDMEQTRCKTDAAADKKT